MLTYMFSYVITGRTQSLHLLTIKDMVKSSKSYILHYSDLLKQTQPGKNNTIVELKAYPSDRRLCCVTVLKEYSKRTEFLRKDTSCLFISYVKLHKPVKSSTLSRWLKKYDL